MFLLPDHPLTTRWLTPEQRQLAHDRMTRDTVGLQESRGAIAGFKQALTDPKLALFVLFQTLHMVRESSWGFGDGHLPPSPERQLMTGCLWF
jgi:hypothetical protein